METSNETIELVEKMNSKIYVIKADNVSSANLLKNKYVKSWGQNTCYLFVDNKFIVAGSGNVEYYIGKNMQVMLLYDGNKTTKFPRSRFDAMYSNVNIYANNIEDFVKQLPKGNYKLYAMK